jgi:DNA-binding FadR family transcriptional regulator
VIRELGLRIVGGSLRPGCALPNEEDLGAELGVSRTVVREAVKALLAKGLVEVRPRTGTRVRPRRAWHLLDPDVMAWQFETVEGTAQDLHELRDVRATIEPSAARLAAERRTDDELAQIDAHCRRMEAAVAEPAALAVAEADFHAAVVDAAHNALLSYVNAVTRVALEATDVPSDATPTAMALRRGVADAIRLGDPVGSEDAMRNLLDLWWEHTAQRTTRRETA